MAKYKLNDSQKQAVQYKSGPLLIVAGAGTGKTSVITEKIVYLLENKLAKPEEILALTFTEKAAAEMQTRVIDLLADSYLDLQISTFHSFAEKLLREYGLDLGLSSQFKVLDTTATWLLIRKNLDNFPLDYYKPLGHPARHIHELIHHFQKCKDELVEPGDYEAYTQELKLDNDQLFIEEKNRLQEVAKSYSFYNQLLLDNNALDFSDLIYYSIKLLKTRPNILNKLQKQYKYILVDEFQDVNWSQYQMIKILAGTVAQLTVVGDDDQSIYAFRGASVSNILRFKDDYQEAKEIVLTNNYRSPQNILNLAYTSVQNNNPDRLEAKLNIDKKLVANKKEQGSIEFVWKADLTAEVGWVINKIKELKAGNSWSDFAILLRSNSAADDFVATLNQEGIPYQFFAASGLFKQHVVLDAINYLKLLNNHYESSALYRLLASPFINLSEADLQELTFFANKKSISLFESLKRTAELNLSGESIKKCELLRNIIFKAHSFLGEQKISVILHNFFEESTYLKALLIKEEEGNLEAGKQLKYLRQFFNYLQKFEAEEVGATLNDFLMHFNYVLEAGDEGNIEYNGESIEAINILTIHRAKGLEYKYVFVPNLVEEKFPTRKRGEGIELPESLIKEHLPAGDYHLEEERRLFYVALTRAKEGLFLSGASDYGGLRKKKISRFLAELNYSIAESVEGEHQENKEIKVEKQNSKITLPNSFSFSQINSYNRCPYQYKLAHILKIPVKGNASFSFGSTMHNTLQKFYTRMQELNVVSQGDLFAPANAKTKSVGLKVPEYEELLKIYESSWQDDWYESAKQKQDYYKKGKEILKVFYNTEENNWVCPILLEAPFKVMIGDYTLSGRIDRIDELPDKTLEIIDYKTGKAKEKVVGDDKDQLLIYQIAATSLPQFKNLGTVAKLTYFYLNDNVRTSFLGDSEEVVKIKEKILATISQISQGNFKAAPSSFVCQSCDFRDICEFRQL